MGVRSVPRGSVRSMGVSSVYGGSVRSIGGQFGLWRGQYGLCRHIWKPDEAVRNALKINLGFGPGTFFKG